MTMKSDQYYLFMQMQVQRLLNDVETSQIYSGTNFYSSQITFSDVMDFNFFESNKQNDIHLNMSLDAYESSPNGEASRHNYTLL